MTEPLHPQDETTPLEPAEQASRGYAARVNLLPREIIAARRSRQIGIASIGVLVIYLVGLTAFSIVASGEVADAAQERDDAERGVDLLQAQADELVPYQTLVNDIESRETLLTTAMDEQLSWARVLGDLALAFSRDASLTQVDATAAIAEPVDGQIVSPAATEEATEGADQADETTGPVDAEPDADEPESVAQVLFTGYSVKQYAPGVAEVLSNFAQAEGFFDSWLTTAADEERGDSAVTHFEGRVELDERAFTRRYSDGLPEEGAR